MSHFFCAFMKKWQKGSNVEEQSNRKSWEPTAVHTVTLILLLSVQLLLIIGIVVLLTISSKNSGFVSLPQDTNRGFNWNKPILWTALPTLVFQLFSLTWSWLACAVRDRQPFTNLRRPKGAPAPLTFTLDYRSKFGLLQWLFAYMNGHSYIGSSLLLSLLLAIFISPLSARLFTEGRVKQSHLTPIQFTHDFNSGRYAKFGQNESLTNWKPIFDTVSAVRIFKGRDIPWTTKEYAFQPFTIDWANTGNGSTVTATVKAWTALTDCVVLRNPSFQENPANRTVLFTAVDRGCSLSHAISVSSIQSWFFQPFVQGTCSSEAGQRRFGFLGGKRATNSTTSLSQPFAISCITGYSESSGNLTVRFQAEELGADNSGPEILGFVQGPQNNIFFGSSANYWTFMENSMLDIRVFNPFSNFSSTELGSMIFYHAMSNASAIFSKDITYPTVDQLLKSIPVIFRSIHTTTVAMLLLSPMANGIFATATVDQIVRRLSVVPWIAVCIITVLFVSLICTVWTFLYVRDNPTALSEEPSDLLSYLGILSAGRDEPGDELKSMVEDVQNFTGAPDQGFKKVANERWDFSKASVHTKMNNKGKEGYYVKGMKRKGAGV